MMEIGETIYVTTREEFREWLLPNHKTKKETSWIQDQKVTKKPLINCVEAMEKLKLTGGPAKTVTWIWLERDRLKVEYYDFSELAQQMFGNDIAYTITVDKMEKLLSMAKQDEKSIVAWMAENFRSYFDIKRWLEDNEIGFRLESESWA